MKTVLFIDDQVENLRSLICGLELLDYKSSEIFIVWVPLIYLGAELLLIKNYQVDLVYVDMNGTVTLVQDFAVEIEKLQHLDIRLTSNIIYPRTPKYPFVNKQDLPADILKTFYPNT